MGSGWCKDKFLLQPIKQSTLSPPVRTAEVQMASAAAEAPRSQTLPGPSEERFLFARWHESGDAGAKEALTRRFMLLARSLARRYDRSSEPFDDLLQVASV